VKSDQVATNRSSDEVQWIKLAQIFLNEAREHNLVEVLSDLVRS
jgi:hypothetical protein